MSTTKLAAAGGAPALDPLPGSLPGRLPLARPGRPSLGRARWRRLVRRLLLAVAILAASYLIVANVLLRTRLLRNAVSGSSVSFALSGRSTDLRLDYASAYSVLPGRAHVEGLILRGRDRRVEWLLTLDRADVAISLGDLLHRRLHATRLRSSGLAMRARLRLARAEATPDVVAALPPIAGFADPPLLDDAPEPPPLTDADYDLWTVDLEDIDVQHVREVWIHIVRSVGDTHVRGRWFFRPRRWLEVGPATVDADGVDVFYGIHPLAAGLRGSTEATVHPFDPRAAKGLAFLDQISSHGQFRGRANVAGALRLLAPRSRVAFTRWEGPLEANLVLDHGTLAGGTRVGIEAADARIDADGLAFEAPVRADVGVDGDRGTLGAHVSSLRVSRLSAERARVASIEATVTSRHLRLTHFFDDARATLDVGGAETADVAAWRDYLPSTSPFVLRSGPATAHGHAEGSLAEERGAASLRLSVRRLAVERGADRVIADVTGDVQLRDVSLSGGLAVGAATLTAGGVTARLGAATLAGKVTAHVDLRRGAWRDRTLDLSGSDVALRDVSAGSARTGKAILVVPSLSVVASRLAIAPSGLGGHVAVDLPGAELIDLGRLRDLLPLPGGLAVQGGAGRARLHADLELGSGAMQGTGEVVTRGLRVRAGVTELFGDLVLAVHARRAGGADGSTDLSGSTLAVRRAGTGGEAPAGDAWWANGTLREATLRTSGGVHFDARGHVTAKDASPATVLVAQNENVPTWAVDIFRMPALDADAEVRVAPRSLEVRSLVARGGNTSVRAEYAKRGGRQDGAALLDLGWIDLGYDLADGSTGLVLVGPQAWFARKTAVLRDATAAARATAEAAEQLERYAAMTAPRRKEEARTLAARCAHDARSCDGASIENLLRATADPGERGVLSGIAHAPIVAAAARWGRDGSTIDPVIVGSVAEALRRGGESTLDDLPSVTRVAAASDSGIARGKVIAVTGSLSAIRRERTYAVGTLTTDAEPVHFVTPFVAYPVPGTLARFRGVFVQRCTCTSEAPDQRRSLVLVGGFLP